MTFLNPALLWGLAAVSIPIIIHIFNLKKTKKIEFSTLIFFREIQQTKYKRLKLKQLLILLCRIMMIIFLVMAFSGPFEKGYLGSGNNPTSVLIVLDNSFSMKGKQQSGSSFELAKLKSKELVSSLKDNSEVYFTTTSDISKGKEFLFKDKIAANDSINKSEVNEVSKPLYEVLYFANKILQNSMYNNKEVFLFTDCQKYFIDSQDTVNVFANEKNAPILNIVNCNNRQPKNISLDTINIVSQIFENGKNVKVKSVIHNFNSYNAVNKSVIITFNNNKPFKDEKIIDIPSGSSVETEFIVRPDRTGFIDGEIRILTNSPNGDEDDEVTNDNVRYFSIYVPEKLNILLVSHTPQEAQYVKLPLMTAGELSDNREALFTITQDDDKALSRKSLDELKRFNSIVIINKESFTTEESEKIKSYLLDGFGVVIFPGPNSLLENYNNTLMPALSLTYINGTYGDRNSQSSFTFGKVDFEHPVMEGIFKEKETKEIKESPSVKFGFRLQDAPDSRTFIRLNNENSFITDYRIGRGKLVFYSISADQSFSDFPTKNIYAPLVLRSVQYAANNARIKEAIAGKEYYPLLDYTKDSSQIMVTGKNFGINIQNTPNPPITLDHSGNYQIIKNRNILLTFPCNFDKNESNFTLLKNSETGNILKVKYHIDGNVMQSEDKMTASFNSVREGKEIWEYFIIIALLFLAAEYYLSKTLLKTDKNKSTNT